jgi:hypothetical protein
VVVVLHERNQGKGAALRTVFGRVTGDVVLVQDTDLEYDPADYPRLLKPILEDKADVVYGSRFGGETHHVLFFWHYVGNRFLTMLSNGPIWGTGPPWEPCSRRTGAATPGPGASSPSVRRAASASTRAACVPSSGCGTWWWCARERSSWFVTAGPPRRFGRPSRGRADRCGPISRGHALTRLPGLCDRVVRWGLVGLIAFTPLAFGTVEPRAVAFVEWGGESPGPGMIGDCMPRANVVYSETRRILVTR